MLLIGLFGSLVYFPCLVFAIGLRAVGDHAITYKCSERPLPSVPRLDVAGVEDLSALQASASVTSVDLVHACDPIPTLFFHGR